jgi:hypothetical protein
MLFVDHDQGEIGNRCEHGGTRPDHDSGFATANTAPLVGALVVGQRRMQNRDLVAKNVVKISCRGWRETDLRHQQNGRAPRLQYRLHGGKIHGGLARTGHAVQKRNRESFFADGFLDCLQRGFLLRVEDEIKMSRSSRLQLSYIEVGRFLDDLDHPALYQSLQRGSRNGKIADQGYACSSVIFFEEGDDLLLILVELR